MRTDQLWRGYSVVYFANVMVREGPGRPPKMLDTPTRRASARATSGLGSSPGYPNTMFAHISVFPDEWESFLYTGVAAVEPRQG